MMAYLHDQNWYGTPNDDVKFFDWAENATLDGGAGNDVIDIISDGEYTKKVLLKGGAGNDNLSLEGTDSSVQGGMGDDLISAFGHRLNLDGGDGNDRIWLRGFDTSDVTVKGGAGKDTFMVQSPVLDKEDSPIKDDWVTIADLSAEDVLVFGIGLDIAGESTLLNGKKNPYYGKDGSVSELTAKQSGNTLTLSDSFYGVKLILQNVKSIDQVANVTVYNGITENQDKNSVKWGPRTTLGSLIKGYKQNTSPTPTPTPTGKLPTGISADKKQVVISAKFTGKSFDLGDYASENLPANVTASANKVKGLAITGDDRANVLMAGSAGNALYGLGGNDSLIGGSGADLLSGGVGNDTLKGNAGNDSLDGGDGTNYLDGGAGNDMLLGGTGNDKLYGGAGNDRLDGGDGANYLDGGAGNDSLRGGDGNDKLYGGVGNDMLDGGDGANYLDGGAGNDSLSGGDGNDTLLGGAGNDLLYGGAGSNSLTGGAGNDLFVYGGGKETITDYGTGKDTISLKEAKAAIKSIEEKADSKGKKTDLVLHMAEGGLITVKNGATKSIAYIDAKGKTKNIKDGSLFAGTKGNDSFGGIGKMMGYAGNDRLWSDDGQSAVTIDGGAGNDSLKGGAGTDSLFGGAGNDTLLGLGGKDTLDGGAGNDMIDGGNGNDILLGGAGNDTLKGGEGSNSLTGDAGNDLFVYGGGNDTITDYGKGKDKISLKEAQRTIKTVGVSNKTDVVLTLDNGKTITVKGAANKTIDYVDAKGAKTIKDGTQYAGTAKGETIPGSEHDDRIFGYGGNDILIGKAGDDYLDGGAGSDSLSGGAGNDTLKGGAGNDTFVYELGDGNDVITDYATGDWLYLSNAGITGVEFTGGKCILRIGDDDEPQGSITLQKFTAKTQVKVKNPYGVYTATKDSLVLTALNNKKGPQDMYMSSAQKTMDLSKAVDGVKMHGNAIANVMKGGKGNDTIWGYGGRDSLFGGSGNDELFGGAGNDLVDGGDGNDWLEGGPDGGNDTLKGGKGNDGLYSESGNTTMNGGAGKDVFHYGGGNVLIEDYNAKDDVFGIHHIGEVKDFSFSAALAANKKDVVLTMKESGTKCGTVTFKNAVGKKITYGYSEEDTPKYLTVDKKGQVTDTGKLMKKSTSAMMVGSPAAQLSTLVSMTQTDSLGALTGASTGLTPVEPANGAVVAANPLANKQQAV